MSVPDGFNPAYYRMVHGDVAEAGMDSIEHYLRFGSVEGRTGVPPGGLHPNEREVHDRFDFFARAFTAIAVNGINGDYLEFGVAHGTTMWLAWSASRRLGLSPKMWAFDSFQGLPDPSNEIDAAHPSWWKGRYTVTESRFRANLGALGLPEADVVTIPGFFSETLQPGRLADLPTEVALAYVDCDMYQSTVDVLGNLENVLSFGSIVAFDDFFCWSRSTKSGEQIALDELRMRRPDFVFNPYLPIGWHGMSFYVTG
jgi:O-methyltransferase